MEKFYVTYMQNLMKNREKSQFLLSFRHAMVKFHSFIDDYVQLEYGASNGTTQVAIGYRFMNSTLRPKPTLRVLMMPKDLPDPTFYELFFFPTPK